MYCFDDVTSVCRQGGGRGSGGRGRGLATSLRTDETRDAVAEGTATEQRTRSLAQRLVLNRVATTTQRRDTASPRDARGGARRLHGKVPRSPAVQSGALVWA